jgi:hypothetical protein
MLSFKTIALTAVVTIIGASEAFALPRQDCFCHVSNGTSYQNGTRIKDYGKIGEFPLGVGFNSAEARCGRACGDKARPEASAIAATACAKGIATGSNIYAFSKAGSIASGNSDHTFGKLTNKAAVYNSKTTCPAGYHEKPGGKCAIGKCSVPGAPDANLGNYGFIWQGNVYQVVNGSVTSTLVHPAICTLN